MPKSKRKSHRRVSPWQGSLRLLLVFAVLIAVNVYFFFLRGGTSVRALLKTAELGREGQPAVIATPPAPAAKKAAASGPEDEPDSRLVEAVMGDQDTVERAWKRDGLAPKDVNELAAALARVFDLKTVRAGHSYQLHFDAEDHVRAVDYRTTPALSYHLEKTAGAWMARVDEKPIETRIVEVGGVVVNSLYDGVKRAGESPSLVSWFVDMFAWDMNFYTDCQAGDRFKVIVEKRYLGGRFYKYGRVLAAEYKGRVGTFRAFWFQPKDGSSLGGGYYTEHGENIVKAMLKIPLKFVRISSGFDRHRFHPVLHTERAHLGVDYAAPVGTPVWATAGGTVNFVGPRGGAGNAVILTHGNGMESVYMHLSKFARGLHSGQPVRQKQVIGYVGATGLATGPHLHFSLKQNGAFVDPLKLRPPREAPLPQKYRIEFADAVAPRLTSLAAITPALPPDLVARGPSPMP